MNIDGGVVDVNILSSRRVVTVDVNGDLVLLGLKWEELAPPR